MTDYPSPRTSMVHFCSPTIPPSPSRGEGTKQRKQNAFTSVGFTLAELLIALAILGVIATFTIPKILDSGTDSKYNAMAKEFAATISEAYQLYKLENGTSISTSAKDLTPYMNYVRISTLPHDVAWADTGQNCTATFDCYVLHNGSLVKVHVPVFNDSQTTNAIYFDWAITADFQGDRDRAIRFYLYYNGLIRTLGSLENNTCNSETCWPAPNPAHDPPWFSWSN